MRYIKPYNEEIDFGKLVPGFLKKKQVDSKKENPKKEDPKEEPKENPISEDPKKYIKDVLTKCFKSFGAKFKSIEEDVILPVGKFKTDLIENNPVKEIKFKLDRIDEDYIDPYERSYRNRNRTVNYKFNIKYYIEIKFENKLVSERTWLSRRDHIRPTLIGRQFYIQDDLLIGNPVLDITFSGNLIEDSNNVYSALDLKTLVTDLMDLCKKKLEDERLKDKFRDEFNEIIPELKDLVSDIDDFANDHDYKIINNQFHCIFDIEVGVIPISLNVESKSRISVGNFKFEMTKELSEIFLLISQLQPRIKHIDSDITAEVEFESKQVTIIFTKPTDVFSRQKLLPTRLGPYPPLPR
jgi:hypothetical protein